MKTLSVCITTFNRPQALSKLINSIIESDIKNYNNRVELLICNNGTNTFQIPDSLMQIAPCEIIKNNKSTASSGRNKLGMYSNADYLTFIDDDTTVSNDYFNQLLSSLDTLDEDIYTGVAGLVIRQRNNSIWDSAWLDAGFDRYFELPKKYPRLKWACTANLTLNTKLFKQVSGFREGPVPVGGEDIDLGLRINGNKLYYLPAPTLISYHEPLIENLNNQLQRKSYFYGCAEQWLAQLYPQYVIDTDAKNINEITSLISSSDKSMQLKGYYLLGGFTQALIYGSSINRISASSMAKGL